MVCVLPSRVVVDRALALHKRRRTRTPSYLDAILMFVCYDFSLLFFRKFKSLILLVVRVGYEFEDFKNKSVHIWWWFCSAIHP